MSFKDDKGRRRPSRNRRPSAIRRFPRSAISRHRQNAGPGRVKEALTRRLVRDLAAAVVCRLAIAEDRTLVGLLGVGRTAGNREEVERWVAGQLATLDEQDWAGSLEILCRRLVRALDRVSSR